MAFDYNSIIPIISGMALLISILSAYYTYYQNQRKMEVDLWIHKDDGTSMVTLCGFNPSYRSLALINFSLIADNKPITILERTHKVPESETGKGTSFSLRIGKNIDLPHMLGEGQAVFFSITAQQLASLLYINNYRNKVRLSGCFKTAQKKIYNTESVLDFDIEKYRFH